MKHTVVPSAGETHKRLEAGIKVWQKRARLAENERDKLRTALEKMESYVRSGQEVGDPALEAKTPRHGRMPDIHDDEPYDPENPYDYGNEPEQSEFLELFESLPDQRKGTP